jgi:cell division protein FtsX
MIFSTAFRQFFYIFFSSKKIFVGGVIPIAIFVGLFASFSLLYTNTFLIVDTLFSVKKYSLIFHAETSKEQVDKTFKTIQDYSQTKEVQKISAEKIQKEITENFEKVSQELASLGFARFPQVIEFILEEGADGKNLLEYLEKQPSTQTIVSGLTASDQISTLLRIIEILGIFFLVLFAVSLFYILNHTIQVSFFYFLKEMEIYLILGANKYFLFSPFLLMGFFIALKGFFIGMFIAYFLFLVGVSLVTFDDSSFFIKDVTAFFSTEIILLSLCSFLAIGIISSFSAIHHAIKKVTF